MANEQLIIFLQKLSNLNPNAAEIGPGMLQYIVSESREQLLKLAQTPQIKSVDI